MFQLQQAAGGTGQRRLAGAPARPSPSHTAPAPTPQQHGQAGAAGVAAHQAQRAQRALLQRRVAAGQPPRHGSRSGGGIVRRHVEQRLRRGADGGGDAWAERGHSGRRCGDHAFQ